MMASSPSFACYFYEVRVRPATAMWCAGRQYDVQNCAVVAIVDASTLDLDGSLRVGWVAKAFALLLGWRRRFRVPLKEPVDAPPSLLV